MPFHRMRETQAGSMQSEPFGRKTDGLAVLNVPKVAHNAVANMVQMYAQLVGATGLREKGEQTGVSLVFE
jgi:hypothetical protein